MGYVIANNLEFCRAATIKALEKAGLITFKIHAFYAERKIRRSYGYYSPHSGWYTEYEKELCHEWRATPTEKGVEFLKAKGLVLQLQRKT